MFRRGNFFRSILLERFSVLILTLLSGAWSPARTRPSNLPTTEEINGVLHELSEITGFRVRRQLPFEMVTRSEINKHLKEEIRHTVKPAEIRAEEIALKKFGFAPPDFDLRKTTIDLLTEQAAAYYDFKRKKLFISDWAAVNMRDEAIVHELAHALADQNFPIGRFIDKAGDDSEMAAARQAVVEGQASWLMMEVNARRQGKTLADPTLARNLFDGQSDSSDPAYPVFNNAPLYIRKTLVFPYDDGEKFQEAVFLHDGKAAFARVFETPPVSTAEIEHPDRYFRGDAPSSPELPRALKHTHPLVTGELGELETRILLEQFLGADVANALGPELRGAKYRVDETEPQAGAEKDSRRRDMLAYVSEWRDEDASNRFFDAYRKVLLAKWKTVEILSESDHRFAGKSEDGFFSVVREGVRVVSEEGFAQPF